MRIEIMRRSKPHSFLLLIVWAALFLSTAPCAVAEEPAVTIGIRAPDNDGPVYLTWAPVPAWARLSAPAAADVVVTLSNDAGSSDLTPAGRRIDGDLAFSATEPPAGSTAAEKSLELTLPKSGEPVQFYLAGAFPQASTEDQDAIIEVRSSDGSLLAERATMVRVRKRFRTLTTEPDGGERARFFGALAGLLDDGAKRYLHFLTIHNWSARGKFPTDPLPPYPGPAYPFPDQAHRGPAFLAWHRAFLLEVERALQESHPDVALPYWPSNQPNDTTKVFTEVGLGHNPKTPSDTVVPEFATGHPLEFWRMPVEGSNPPRWEPIQRFGGDPYENIGGASDDQILRRGDYARFADSIERNPHNPGHNFTGPWLRNCRISPRDPIFWVFHAWFDRMWAEWQWTYGRFDHSEDSYSPQGTFPPEATTGPPLGHYLEDTMWPWNDIIGKQANPLASRPPVRLTGPFDASGVAGIWPGESTTATPAPGDLIDYPGSVEGNLDHGFCYDEIPFGTKPEEASDTAQEASMQDDDPQGVFFESDAPLEDRLAAADDVDLEAGGEARGAARELLHDSDAHDALRATAMKLLTKHEPNAVLRKATAILTDAADGGEELDVQAVHSLGFIRMFHNLSEDERKQSHAALRAALEDERAAVKATALTLLSGARDEKAIQMLKEGLAAPEKLVVDHPSAIHLLASAAGEDAHEDLRPFVTHKDVATRAAAVSQLGPDSASREAITKHLRDPKQPLEVREAACEALLYHDKQFAKKAFALIENPETPEPLRQKLIRALRVQVRINPTELPEDQLRKTQQKLDQLQG